MGIFSSVPIMSNRTAFEGAVGGLGIYQNEHELRRKYQMQVEILIEERELKCVEW